MPRKPIIPDYDHMLTLAQAAKRAACSDAKIRKAVRFGHLEPMPRVNENQRHRFLLTEVTRWINAGASAERPEGFVAERPEPEALVAFRKHRKAD